jgi:hypothetical protein
VSLIPQQQMRCHSTIGKQSLQASKIEVVRLVEMINVDKVRHNHYIYGPNAGPSSRRISCFVELLFLLGALTYGAAEVLDQPSRPVSRRIPPTDGTAHYTLSAGEPTLRR